MDVNECQETMNGGCSDLRECENTLGSFRCGPCPAGYVEDGDLHCQFSDPCAAGVHNCQKMEYCNNYAIGEFHCFVSLFLSGQQNLTAFFLSVLPPRSTVSCPDAGEWIGVQHRSGFGRCTGHSPYGGMSHRAALHSGKLNTW